MVANYVGQMSQTGEYSFSQHVSHCVVVVVICDFQFVLRNIAISIG